MGVDLDFNESLKSDDQIELDKKNYVVASVAEDGLSLTLAAPYEEESLSKADIFKVNAWTPYRNPCHSFMVIIIGSLSILLVGILGEQAHFKINRRHRERHNLSLTSKH